MDIVFIDYSFEHWNPETLERDGGGGSEFMLADFSKRLAARGHKVCVYTSCTSEMAGDFAGVRWRQVERFPTVHEIGGFDVFVAWRQPEEIDKVGSVIMPHATIFVATDCHYGDRLTPERCAKVNSFVVMSEWHKQQFLEHHPHAADKIHVIRTGVDKCLFDEVKAPHRIRFQRERRRMAHTSAPTRSLEKALLAMPAIRECFPDATLHVYHGFLTLEAFARARQDSGMLAYIEKLKSMLVEYKQHGVHYHGRIGRGSIYNELLAADLWVYPSTTAETSCMAAQEAQAAGCRLVTVNIGAMPQTASGIKLLDNPWSDDFLERYTERVVATLAREESEESRVQRAREFMEIFDLDKLVIEYEDLMFAALDQSGKKSYHQSRGSRERVSVPEQTMDHPALREYPPSRGVEKKNSKICLTMIVKNEGPIIADALRRVKRLIDSFVIVDTGSTDDTKEVVLATLDGLPGVYVDRPWVSFGYNRTEQLYLARERSDAEWLLLLDSDCMVETPLDRDGLSAKLAETNIEQYLVKGYLGGLEYDKLMVVKSHLAWHYDLPTHEWLYCDDAMRWGYIHEVRVVEVGHSHRRKSGKKFTEDIAMLEAYLAQPSAKHKGRALFYLAQSYRDEGRTAEALATYRTRAELTGHSINETNEAFLEVARLSVACALPREEVVRSYDAAEAAAPFRSEAPFELAQYLRLQHKDYVAAEPYARRAAEKPMPTTELFPRYDYYQWRAKDELGTVLSWQDTPGKREEAQQIFEALLASPALPEHERERVKGAAELCRDLVARAKAALPVTVEVTTISPVEVAALESAPVWNIVSPPSWTFPVTKALDDVANIVESGMRDAGWQVTRSIKCVRGERNLLIGAHAHLDGWKPGITPDTVIYQTEVVDSQWFRDPRTLDLLKSHKVWDYSRANAARYKEFALDTPDVVPLGFSSGLSLLSKFEPREKDVDVLFYGSINERRERILGALEKTGLVVKRLPPDTFGLDREMWILSSKIVLNVHYYETGPIAQSRAAVPIANGILVVSERSAAGLMDWIDHCVSAWPYERLVEACLTLCQKDRWRYTASSMTASFKSAPMLSHLITAAEKLPPLAAPNADSVARVEPVAVRLNLGCSDAHEPGYLNVDRVPPADLVADLQQRWPWKSSTVDEIRAHDFIEHLPDKIHTMNEAWRVLKPGGIFKIVVPTTDGRGAYQDPTHVSYWNRNSFWYYTDGDAHRERFGDAYGVKARFRVVHEEEQSAATSRLITHLTIHLVAVKPLVAPKLAAASACVACERAWVPHVFGPQIGAPCPFCGKPTIDYDTTSLEFRSAGSSSRRGASSRELQMLDGESIDNLSREYFESSDLSAQPGFVSQQAQRVTAVREPTRFVAMLRVKNEARWIERALRSLAFCDTIQVLDDHSTDDTGLIVDSVDAKVTLWHSPFSGLDEVRDKNFLLGRLRLAVGARPCWVINIDGDEELEAGAHKKLLQSINPSTTALSLRVRFLWGSERMIRTDGVYENFYRESVFKLIENMPRFERTDYAKGGLHCGNMPAAMKKQASRVDLNLWHYGYLRRADRVRKYRWYNQVDPGNANEDHYRHIIQGDGPADPGEEDILFPGVDDKLKWAGPMTVAPRSSLR